MSGPTAGPDVCTDEHLAYLMAAALRLGRAERHPPGSFRWETTLLEEMLLTQETLQWTGRMLRETNEASVREWTGEPLPEYRPFRIQGFSVRPAAEFNPVQVIRAARGYSDSAVYAAGWTNSRAACFTEALMEAAIHQLDGYQEASPAGPPAEGVFMSIQRQEP